MGKAIKIALLLIPLIMSGCGTDPGHQSLRVSHPGPADAALRLGYLIKSGKVSTSRYGEAEIWFKKACELGHKQGCSELGVEAP